MRIFIFLSSLVVVFFSSLWLGTLETKDKEHNPRLASKQLEVEGQRVFLALRVQKLPRETVSDSLKQYLSYLGSSHVKKIGRVFYFPEKKGEFSLKEGPIDLIELSFTEEASLEKEIQNFRKKEAVLFVEREQLNFPAVFRRNSGESNLLKNLDLYNRKDFFWWQKQIAFDKASIEIKKSLHRLNLKNELRHPLIAVIDSGTDYHHPALMSRLWRNPKVGQFMCGEDLHGCNTTTANQNEKILGTPDIFPFGTTGPHSECSAKTGGECSHGTQVAGLIVGESQEYGMIGLCPMCEIMTLKVMQDVKGEGSISDFAIINALKYIAYANQNLENRVRVINASFGKFQRSKTTTLLMRYLREAYDVLIVAAAGNETTRKPLYPGASRDVLSVGALNQKGDLTGYSNFGYHVNLFAPGGEMSFGLSDSGNKDVALLSSVPGRKGYQFGQGTSFAAPIVSGSAGFFLALNPELTRDELESILLRTGYQSSTPTLNMSDSVGFMLSGEYKLSPTERNHVNCGGLPFFMQFSRGSQMFLLLLFLSPIGFSLIHRRVSAL